VRPECAKHLRRLASIPASSAEALDAKARLVPINLDDVGNTVLDVPLISGRTVKARIGPYHREGPIKKGTAVPAVTEVYADEI
jgi:hypothetical protein